MVVEKYSQRLAAPKAHALCPRSLEICRQFGLETRKLRSLGTPNFVTNLSGERLGVLPYERMDLEVLNDTPEMIHNIPQPNFEEIIASALADAPDTEVRKGVAFVSCEQTGSNVLSRVQERSTARDYTIRSKYVVGCDGAKSAVRAHLDIGCDGEDFYDTMMTIHFRADLRKVLGPRVGMLHWILDPVVSGFIIGYDLSGNTVLIKSINVRDQHPVEVLTLILR